MDREGRGRDLFLDDEGGGLCIHLVRGGPPRARKRWYQAGMQDAELYDAIVIGGGPAGYVCAIRLGQLGARVACVEAEEVGGCA